MSDTQSTHTPYALARLAECASPDSLDSPGARFLASVADAVADHIDYNEGAWDDDDAHEIADGAVPVYTHERWQVFVDLAAYQEDPSEWGEITDMTEAAAVCLYMIAERLACAVAAEITEGGDDD